MNEKPVRVRFAPAPTGMMHLGNIRTALMNFLFAQQKHGTFVLRIEDTDFERNYDPDAIKIQEDLAWLHLHHTEGPGKGGAYGPYFQSQRGPIYREMLDQLIAAQKVYRCFCTEKQLEEKRQLQIILKQPPRYDRSCFNLAAERVEELLLEKHPFIWRFAIDHTMVVEITDLARGIVRFELQHFSDFPLTRQDGSFTFIFANFVDDMTMKMTHVFRGEDHLSNTANQAALYHAFNAPLPIFWHMPILCNAEGKKLSKRDFGFSLRDLKESGYLPQAICNYLAILGGSFEHEIMSLEELTSRINFDAQHTSGQIRYDLEKLRWMNHHWMMRLPTSEIAPLCLSYLHAAYPEAMLTNELALQLIEPIKNDLITLPDAVEQLRFYFVEPTIKKEAVAALQENNVFDTLALLIKQELRQSSSGDQFVSSLKKKTKESGIALQSLFMLLRLLLTGKQDGPTLATVITMLGWQKSAARIAQGLTAIEAA